MSRRPDSEAQHRGPAPAEVRDLAPHFAFQSVNRSLVVVRPRAPFLDWVNEHPDTDRPVRIEEFDAPPLTGARVRLRQGRAGVPRQEPPCVVEAEQGA